MQQMEKMQEILQSLFLCVLCDILRILSTKIFQLFLNEMQTSTSTLDNLIFLSKK